MNQPLFSIVIPTYNRVSLLKNALGTALTQKYKNLEIIVLNNASNDGTKEYLNEMASEYAHIKVVHNTNNIGFNGNIKQVKNFVNGKYVNILSDDDYLSDEFVGKAVETLELHALLSLWYCRVNYVNKDREVLSQTAVSPNYESGQSFINTWLKGKRSPLWVSVVFRVDILKKVDWFCCDGFSTDMAAILACAHYGGVAYTDKVLCYYMVDASNLTSKLKKIDAFRNRVEMQKHVTKHTNMSCRLWVHAHIRTLFFNATKVSFVEFKEIYRRVFAMSKIYTLIYSFRYAHNLILRMLLREGKLFKLVQKLKFMVK